MRRLTYGSTGRSLRSTILAPLSLYKSRASSHDRGESRGISLQQAVITGRFGFSLRSAYSASKQAIHGFIETLFLENKQNNIRASVIIPGRVRDPDFLSCTRQGRQGNTERWMTGRQTDCSGKAADIIIRGINKKPTERFCKARRTVTAVIRRICPWCFSELPTR
jgi:short-subunit dehydrogenase